MACLPFHVDLFDCDDGVNLVIIYIHPIINFVEYVTQSFNSLILPEFMFMFLSCLVCIHTNMNQMSKFVNN